MRLEIESATKCLIGKGLWGFSRAANLATFQIGNRQTLPSRKGGTRVVGEYALHIDCAWNITREDQIVMASQDLYYPAGHEDPRQSIPEEFDWERDPNRLDELSRALFQDDAREFVVKGIEVGAAGSLSLELSDGYRLEVFPDNSSSYEFWRLFKPGVDESHFVVTNRGVEK